MIDKSLTEDLSSAKKERLFEMRIILGERLFVCVGVDGKSVKYGKS